MRGSVLTSLVESKGAASLDHSASEVWSANEWVPVCSRWRDRHANGSRPTRASDGSLG
jgi:hypothetical protein